MDHHGTTIGQQEIKENTHRNMCYYDKMEGLHMYLS